MAFVVTAIVGSFLTVKVNKTIASCVAVLYITAEVSDAALGIS